MLPKTKASFIGIIIIRAEVIIGHYAVVLQEVHLLNSEHS